MKLNLDPPGCRKWDIDFWEAAISIRDICFTVDMKWKLTLLQ